MILNNNDINGRRYRLLVDLKTDLVIWMSDPTIIDIPQITYDLLNIIAITVDTTVPASYNSYRLYFNNNSGGFYSREPTEGIIQHKEYYRLLRAKLNVVVSAVKQTEYQYLKNDNVQRQFFKKIDPTSQRCIDYISQEYNISKEDAVKYIIFKKQEYDDIEFEQETLLHTFINSIKTATTLEQVANLYQQRGTNLWDANKIEIDDIAPPFKL